MFQIANLYLYKSQFENKLLVSVIDCLFLEEAETSDPFLFSLTNNEQKHLRQVVSDLTWNKVCGWNWNSCDYEWPD